jgi:hypothetical protein
VAQSILMSANTGRLQSRVGDARQRYFAESS